MYYALLVILLIDGPQPAPKLSSKTTADIVSRHKKYAEAHLGDADKLVAAFALDALATLDPVGYAPRIERNLNLPSGDPLLVVSLQHLKGHARRDVLDRAAAIMVQAAKERSEIRSKQRVPSEVNLSLEVESAAVELLLASSDASARAIGASRLEEIVEHGASVELSELHFALELAGQYRLPAVLKKNASQVSARLPDEFRAAAVKSGDKSAADELRKKLWQGDPAIISDDQLVDALGIGSDQLVRLARRGDKVLRVAAAGQLARRGDFRELEAAARDLNTDADSDAISKFIDVSASVGNESLLPCLDTLCSNLSAMEKLSVAKALFLVVRRAENASK